jgi:hypothetical protein
MPIGRHGARIASTPLASEEFEKFGPGLDFLCDLKHDSEIGPFRGSGIRAAGGTSCETFICIWEFSAGF